MIPILRFHDYQSNWSKSSIGDIAKVTSGGTPSRANKEYWGGDIPWVTTSQIDFDDISNAEEFITDSGLKNSAAKLFPKGTILLALYGQGVTRGRVSVLKIDATTNQACAAILLNSTDNDTRFVFYYLQSRYESIRNLSNGGGQKNLSGGLIKSLPIALPIDISEQKKIAEFLTSVDTKISQLTEKHRLFKEYKKGVMQQIFSQQIRFKDEDGNAFPEWKEYALKEILLLQSDSLKMGDEEIYELITVKRGFGGVKSRGYFKGKDVLVKNQFTIHENEFVISKRQIVHGACGLVPSELDGAIVSNEYNVFRPVEELLDIEYFNRLTTTPFMRRAFFINSDGVHIEKLLFKTQGWLKTRVYIPCLEEQQKITSFLQAIDFKIKAIVEQIEQTKQFKKGLLQQMFV
ncbi:restriction endonuclease subunit S [Vibrio harveyi]|uniref:restriction endonuclease subunit S n=1 Tax=Vibrio harveyi TaxID=669 RepID=UPI002380B75B|nr:restriction endonuclease subunit S [Vibrio harveyi]